MEMTVKNYSSAAICRFREQTYTSTTREFTYTFTSGVYALTGQIDCGGWAFVYSLCPTNPKDVCIYNDPNYILNKEEVTLKHLQSISCYLGNYTSKTFDYLNKSAEKQLENAYKKYDQMYSLEDVKTVFGLTSERFARPLHMTGNEAWRITAAVGIANKKKIFCYPWMTNNRLQPLLYSTEHLAQIIKQNNGILLLPVENDDLVKRFINGTVNLGNN